MGLFKKLNSPIHQFMKDDFDLIRKCRKGENHSQIVFFNKYKNFIMGICVRYCDTNEDAEDVLQETFIKVFQNLHLHNPNKSTKAWIRKITINMAINHWHKIRKFKVVTNLEAIAETVPDKIHDILDELQTEMLLKIVRSLPAEYRIVFNLHAIEGFNHREISSILKIPINTSKSHLRRGISILKKELMKIGYKERHFEKIG